MKCCKFIPRALVVLGILFGVFLVNPACYAGGAVILMPAEDRDVPEGSQIPEWRSKEIEKKVREYKQKMKEKYPEQQQERLPQNELPKPKVTKEWGN
jgi:uncharacterized membrane protein